MRVQDALAKDMTIVTSDPLSQLGVFTVSQKASERSVFRGLHYLVSNYSNFALVSTA